MTGNKKLLYIRNGVLVVLAVLCPIICRLFSRPLPSTAADDGSLYIRNITNYMRENSVPLIFFLVFVTSGLTALLLGSLIYRRFDRNRSASFVSIRSGAFFLVTALYCLAGSRSLFVFPETRAVAGYLCAASFVLMPLLFLSYAKLIYQRKWMAISDWFFTATAVCFFLLGIFGAPQQLISWLIIVNGLLFCALVICAAALHMWNLKGKSIEGKVLQIVFCGVQIALLAASPTLYFLGWRNIYILCVGLALTIMAYLEFSEMLNIAARQYIKSAEYESVRRMAYMDSLCNIGNRNAFMREQEASFDCDVLCYIVFDLNNLKGVNDRFGHAEGDKLIKKAAELIALTFGEFGKSFRIGGDEFAVIGCNKTLAQVQRLIRDLNEHIDAYNRRSPLRLDLAYGYALRQNTDTSTYELFNKADKEMYRFKKRCKSNS